MGHVPGPPDSGDWQPATSRPGELYTVEGQIRSARSFARGLVSKDPRRKPFCRSMQRTALWIVALGAGLVAAVLVLQAVF